MLQPYTAFVIERPRPSSDLYALSDRLIAQDVTAITATEGPIHADMLYQRMAKLYGIERAGSEVRRVVDRALREATRAGDVVRRGRFYWPRGVERIAPREAGPRTIDHIAPEELQDAVLLALRESGPLDHAAAIRATSRALGFQRTGSALQSGISATIDALLAAGRVQGAGGLLQAE